MVQGSTDLRAGGALRGGPARSRLNASSPSDRCPFALPERRAAGALCSLLASVRRSAAPARLKPVRKAGQLGFGKRQTRRRDRMRVGSGKSVSVRVDICGGRIIKKKNT